jgi:hypothetical protein
MAFFFECIRITVQSLVFGLWYPMDIFGCDCALDRGFRDRRFSDELWNDDWEDFQMQPWFSLRI